MMIDLRIQGFILIILIIALILLCGQVKNRVLDLKYTLPWFFLVFIFLIIDFFPGIIIGLSDIVGITTPSNMLFLCGYILLIVLIYMLTRAVSKISDNIRSMAQKIALLEKELEKYGSEEDR